MLIAGTQASRALIPAPLIVSRPQKKSLLLLSVIQEEICHHRPFFFCEFMSAIPGSRIIIIILVAFMIQTQLVFLL